MNRNWAYKWGCCNGSSGSKSSDTYRGPAPESTPEVKVVADFVRSRVIGGKQQIRAAIDFHTYSELVLWPFGWTYSDTAPGMTQDDRDAFAAVGRKMAASNGYTPSSPATCTSPTGRSTTGSGATSASSATPSRCTRAAPPAAASTRPTR